MNIASEYARYIGRLGGLKKKKLYGKEHFSLMGKLSGEKRRKAALERKKQEEEDVNRSDPFLDLFI